MPNPTAMGPARPPPTQPPRADAASLVRVRLARNEWRAAGAAMGRTSTEDIAAAARVFTEPPRCRHAVSM